MLDTLALAQLEIDDPAAAVESRQRAIDALPETADEARWERFNRALARCRGDAMEADREVAGER